MSGRVRTLLPRQPAEPLSNASFSFEGSKLERRVGFEPTSSGLKIRDPRPLDDRRLVDHQRIELCRQRSCKDRPRTQRIAQVKSSHNPSITHVFSRQFGHIPSKFTPRRLEHIARGFLRCGATDGIRTHVLLPEKQGS